MVNKVVPIELKYHQQSPKNIFYNIVFQYFQHSSQMSYFLRIFFHCCDTFSTMGAIASLKTSVEVLRRRMVLQVNVKVRPVTRPGSTQMTQAVQAVNRSLYYAP